LERPHEKNRKALPKSPSPSPSEIVKAEAEAQRRHTRRDRAAFEAAHRKGMAALKRGDYDMLAEAIQEERTIIRRHQPKLFVVAR
jgi:hypothetical protein